MYINYRDREENKVGIWFSLKLATEFQILLVRESIIKYR